MRDGVDIIPWTTTTKNLGADVAWLDDKKGGPGKGWYSLYVRAVDPGGNRDIQFSTRTNVYRWYYVPPIPWGAVSGCIVFSLLLIAAGYYEYRRRKRKATMQRFQLRRLRRKFKLRNAHQEVHEKVFQDRIPSAIAGDSRMRRRRDANIEHSSNSRHSSRGHRSDLRRMRQRGDRSHSRSHRSREDRSHEQSRSRRSRGDRSHSRSHRSHSRSKSKPRSISHENGHHSGIRERRRKRLTAEERAEEEARNRRRRDREKLRRDLRQYG